MTRPNFSQSSFARVFRHRDFRLLWVGAFLSFVGSWIQNVAQGYLVYDLTHDEAKLALVTFCGMAPVSVLGPFAGTLADAFNKKTLLIIAQAIMGLGAFVLAVTTHYHVIAYWQIITVALVFGVVGCFEMPTRQSIVGKTVPPEDLAAAVPLNAMTFNIARIVGPAVGTALLATVGAKACYLLNAFSFGALIWAAWAIRADLRPVKREPQPVLDLILEGMRYTFRDRRLRTLFIMEATVSAFGLAYLSLMPAYTRDILHLREAGLGFAMISIGIGAMIGLLLTASLAQRPVKAKLIQGSMTIMGAALATMAFARTEYVAFPLLAVVGGSAIVQFNTTNSLFQTLSPERLRGRVISMHVWALSGVGPFGTLFFGWLARETKSATALPLRGIPLIFFLGGICVLFGATWGYFNRHNLKDVR